jgi:hypothetical protein
MIIILFWMTYPSHSILVDCCTNYWQEWGTVAAVGRWGPPWLINVKTTPWGNHSPMLLSHLLHHHCHHMSCLHNDSSRRRTWLNNQFSMVHGGIRARWLRSQWWCSTSPHRIVLPIFQYWSYIFLRRKKENTTNSSHQHILIRIV